MWKTKRLKKNLSRFIKLCEKNMTRYFFTKQRIVSVVSMTTTQILIEFKKCIAKQYLKNGMLPWEIWFRMSIYLHCEKSKWWYIYNWKMWLVVKLITWRKFLENCQQCTTTFITITRQRNILLPIYLPLPKNRTPVIYVMFLNEHKLVST